MTLSASHRLVIGMTGLPCSGKSYVAALLASGEVTGEHAELVKADDIGHEVLNRPEVRDLVSRHFHINKALGAGEFRRQVAERVFVSPDDLAWLEGLVHPLVDKEIEEKIAGATKRIVVVEAALLLAAGLDRQCDVILVVSASRKTRLERASRRGWDAKELERREARLVPLLARVKMPDLAKKTIYIENDADGASIISTMRNALSAAIVIATDERKHDE